MFTLKNINKKYSSFIKNFCMILKLIFMNLHADILNNPPVVDSVIDRMNPSCALVFLPSCKVKYTSNE